MTDPELVVVTERTPQITVTEEGVQLSVAGAGVPGPQGPQGPAGQDGATGPQGPAGPAGPAGSQGPAGATGAQGPQGPAGADGNTYDFRGAWDNSTAYAKDDVVHHEGSSWIALVANTASEPAAVSTDWGELALAGAQGPQGDPGPTGATGATGPQGPAGPQGPQGPPGSDADVTAHEAKDRTDDVHGLDAELDAIETAIAGKAAASHTHAQSEVTNLTTDLAAKQPLDADLTALAALTTTTFGRSILEVADATAARTLLSAAAASHTHAQGDVTNLVTDLAAKQPLDAMLTALAALNTVADRGLYFTGADTPALFTLTAAARTLLDDTSVAAMATTLGLGTGSSPQFTAVNVGHASDTTLARASAGNLTVEGNLLYRAGGTDVPVADGGTGASDAATARTNLGLSAAGGVLSGTYPNPGFAADMATQAELDAHASNALLHPPAYGAASLSAAADTAISAAAFPAWADAHASLQKTITADGTSPLVVRVTLPGVYRNDATSGSYALGIREGTGDPLMAVLKAVGAADESDNIHFESAPFVPSAGSHTYKLCATYIGGASDLMLSTPLTYFVATIEVVGRRTT